MLNKNDRSREKKTITQEKHPGCVTQGHKLAALMKKRKEEILHNKEQPAEQLQNSPSVQSLVQSTERSPVQSVVSPSIQPSVQSNDTCIYGIGILTVLAIGV